MEGELWLQLYPWIDLLDKQHSQKRAVHRDARIVQVYLWAVLHDRPTCWACEADHWTTAGKLRPPLLPSQPTMSRRLRSAGVLRFLNELEQALRSCLVLLGSTLIKLLDGKPLPIGGYSSDPDAAWGHAVRNYAKGYKFHGLWTDRLVPYWELAPMNVAESIMARRLVRHLDPDCGGYVLSDCANDSNDLHRRCAQRGHQLVAPPKKADRKLGHRKHQPSRLHALELLRRPFGRGLYRLRTRVEGLQGQWTSFGAGLAPLPAWVRRLHRVKLWVQAKLLINAVRIRRNLERVN